MAAGAKRRLQHLPRAMCSGDPVTPSLPAQHLAVPGEGKPTATWNGGLKGRLRALETIGWQGQRAEDRMGTWGRGDMGTGWDFQC